MLEQLLLKNCTHLRDPCWSRGWVWGVLLFLRRKEQPRQVEEGGENREWNLFQEEGRDGGSSFKIWFYFPLAYSAFIGYKLISPTQGYFAHDGHWWGISLCPNFTLQGFFNISSPLPSCGMADFGGQLASSQGQHTTEVHTEKALTKMTQSLSVDSTVCHTKALRQKPDMFHTYIISGAFLPHLSESLCHNLLCLVAYWS